MSNIFTVDVEDYYQVEAFASTIDRSRWDTYESRVVNNTHKILDLLDAHEVRGTFFVLGCVAEKHPDLVRQISDRGHEIASHGMSHRLVYKQTPEIFRDETRKAKALLEDIVQKEVRGYRAATYSITQRSLWALDILVEEGFKYDSSIFPMRHDKYGMPDIDPLPHQIQTKSGPLVEIPITVYRKGPISIPCAGGGYFRLWPYWFTKWCLGAVGKRVEFNFYLHPWEVDADQPRIANAGWLSKFRHYNNLDKCQGRLDRLLSDFKFSTASEFLTTKGLL